MPELHINKLFLQPPLLANIQVSIDYKYYLDETWVNVITNATVDVNGNILTSPLLRITGLDYDTRYTVRAINEQCETIFQEDYILPCSAGCPPGFTLSPDGSYCYSIETIAAIPPSGIPDVLVSHKDSAYNICGTYIYSTYNFNGTGTKTLIPVTNAFWRNNTGLCVAAGTLDGPINRAGVWASTTQDNQDIGFSICIELEADGIYYVLLGADNYGIIKLDAVTLIQQDPTAMGGSGTTFQQANIYPIFMTAGPHYLEVLGHNVSSTAAVAVEVYNNTSAQIIAATSYAGLNLIFSSKDSIGKPVSIGTGDAGYTCDSGYSLASCQSPLVCQKIIKVDKTC